MMIVVGSDVCPLTLDCVVISIAGYYLIIRAASAKESLKYLKEPTDVSWYFFVII